MTAPKLPSAPSPAGETASEPDKGRFYPCAHECGKSVEWIEASSQWEHCDGGEYCDMGGESYVTAWPKGFPEPEPVPEPVSTEGAIDRSILVSPDLFLTDEEIAEAESAASSAGETAEEDWFPYPVAAPIAPAAVSAKAGSVAGWALYRAVRDFLDSARAGTPFGLEVMDAAVSEWEAENPPNAQPSAEGDEMSDEAAWYVRWLRGQADVVLAYLNDGHSDLAAKQLRELLENDIPAPSPSGQGEVK